MSGNTSQKVDQVIQQAQQQVSQGASPQMVDLLKSQGLLSGESTPPAPEQTPGGVPSVSPTEPNPAPQPPPSPSPTQQAPEPKPYDPNEPFTLPGAPNPEPDKTKGPEPQAQPSPSPSPAPKPDDQEPRIATIGPPQQQPLSQEDLVTAAAKAATQAIQGQQTSQPKTPEIEIPEGIDLDSGIAQRLIDSQPERYGNLAKELSQAKASYDAYVSRWQTANPEKTFDPNESDHNDFFDKLNSSIHVHSPDIQAAERAIIREEIERDVLSKAEQTIEEKYGKKFQQFEEQARQQAVQQELAKHSARVEDAIIKAFRPDDIGKKDRGAIVDDIKNDQLAMTLAAQTQAWQEPLIQQGVTLLSGYEQYSPENPNHSQFISRLSEVESQVSQSRELFDEVARATGNAGKQMVSWAQWQHVAPNQRGQYWSLMDPNVFVSAVSEIASQGLRDQYSKIVGQFRPHQQQVQQPYSSQNQNQQVVTPIPAPTQSPTMTPSPVPPPSQAPTSQGQYAGINPDFGPQGLDQILARRS